MTNKKTNQLLYAQCHGFALNLLQMRIIRIKMRASVIVYATKR